MQQSVLNAMQFADALLAACVGETDNSSNSNLNDDLHMTEIMDDEARDSKEDFLGTPLLVSTSAKGITFAHLCDFYGDIITLLKTRNSGATRNELFLLGSTPGAKVTRNYRHIWMSCSQGIMRLIKSARVANLCGSSVGNDGYVTPKMQKSLLRLIEKLLSTAQGILTE